VDVGPFVLSDAEVTKLVQPRERPLDNPTPLSPAAAMLPSAHGQQWEDVAGSKPPSDALRVVGTVAQVRSPDDTAVDLGRPVKAESHRREGGLLVSGAGWHRSTG
jgi:hypothetical protein